MVAEKSQTRTGEERDKGVLQAIEAAGSVGKLARALGISQPAVSSWSKVPADRVIAVETFTGVPRHKLRPDLYRADDGKAPTADPVNEARQRHYMLLAALLLHAPDEALLRGLAQVKGDASPLGFAMVGLADAARQARAELVEREYFDLFIGVGRGELLPFASYYQTGFLNERPLARVREDMKRLGIARREAMFEPEDHLGCLLEVMAGLISGEFSREPQAAEQFFKRHIERWGLRFFDDLAKTETARFYRAVAAVGQVFLSIESEAFTLPAGEDELNAAE